MRPRWRPLPVAGRQGPPAGYKTSLTGRCFRCLGRDHKIADCRDPLCCLACRRNGHLARDCPAKREGTHRPPVHSRLNFQKPTIQSRLTFPKQAAPSIQNRLVFLPLREEENQEVGDATPLPVSEMVTPEEEFMAWYLGMSESRPVAGSAVVITTIAMTQETTKLRTRAVLLVARDRPLHDDIGIGDISRVVAGCVRMPPHEMQTTRHRPEDFMIVFEQPHQRTLALRVGAVRCKGVTFNVVPWYEHIHGGDVSWWYHVRMAIENLPSHAWNLGALKQVLGEACLIDKIDWVTFSQQSSDIIYC